MTQRSSSIKQDRLPSAQEWVAYLPDGAISLALEGSVLVLHASESLQERFEQLLEQRKSRGLSPEEEREYQAMCEMDIVLSRLNRLARSTPQS